MRFTIRMVADNCVCRTKSANLRRAPLDVFPCPISHLHADSSFSIAVESLHSVHFTVTRHKSRFIHLRRWIHNKMFTMLMNIYIYICTFCTRWKNISNSSSVSNVPTTSLISHS